MRWAFVDIDNTMIKTPRLQQQARQAIEQAGYHLCFVTSRTSETLISWAARRKSSKAVQARPKAKPYGDPALYRPFAGLVVAPYIAATTGVELLSRTANGGYRYDTQWMKQLQSLGTPRQWIRECQRCVIPEATLMIPTDVAQPWYRVQLNFSSRSALRKQVRQLPSQVSWQDESNPSREEYSIYLLPNRINKQTVVDHLIAQHPTPEKVLMIGDSQTDQLMGLHAGNGCPSTFLIVGGARLVQLLPSTIKRQFKPQSQTGWYRYHDRVVIIGDQAFPGTIGPETILTYLRTQH